MKQGIRIMAALLAMLFCMSVAGAEDAFEKVLLADELAIGPVEYSLTLQVADVMEEALRYNERMALYDDDLTIDMGPAAGYSQDTVVLEADMLYEDVDILSLSPDGTRLFAFISEMPVVLDFAENRMHLLAPAEDLDADYVSAYIPQLYRAVEDASIAWSADGRYIALSFPRKSFMMMRFDMNVILIDVEQGTMEPVMDGVFDAPPIGPDFQGAPVRAAFHPVDGLLYYEVYSLLREDIDMHVNELRSYDPRTRETKSILQYDRDGSTVEPLLWFYGDSLVQAYVTPNHQIAMGIVFRDLTGGAGTMTRVRNEVVNRIMRQGHLIDLQGDSAVYMARVEHITSGADMQILVGLVPFSLPEISANTFDRMLAIWPGKPSEERVEWLDMTAFPNLEEGIVQALEDGDLVIPYNAALSPDGSYLLAAAMIGEETPLLYVIDMKTYACGAISLDGLGVAPQRFALNAVPANSYHRGIRWLQNNKIMLDTAGHYRIYELSVSISEPCKNEHDSVKKH